MPKSTHRYSSEREIIAAINQCHRDSNSALKEADALDATATEYFKVASMIEDAQLKRAEACRLREKARRLVEVKAKKLGDALAEFRTETLPFLTDKTIQSI